MACGIKNFVHKRRSIGVFFRKNVAADFNEVAVELAFVPLGKNIVEFLLVEAQTIFQDVVGLADKLHVTVFDAVVHHFDIVAGTFFSHPIAAWRTVFDFCGNGLENILHMWPCGRGTAGHDAWSAPGSFLATRDTGSDKKQALGFELTLTAARVIKERISTVDDDIARLQMGSDLSDKIVHRLAGLHEHHHAARTLEFGNQLLNRVRPLHLGALCFICQKVVHF